jgi:hypothetical protein
MARSSLLSRDETGSHLGRPDDQRLVGFQQFALRGDESQAASGGPAECDCVGKLIDKPGVAQQVLDQIPVDRLVPHHPVRPSDHAGTSLEVAARHQAHGRGSSGGGRQGVQADQADSALRLELAGLDAADPSVSGDDDVLSGIAQRHVDQGSDLDAGFQQVRDHAVDFRAFLDSPLPRLGQ